MKKALFILAIAIASASASFAQGVAGRISIDVIIGNRQPNPNELNMMRVEEARHPNITKSMHDLEDAMRHLNEAPDAFGGHKGQAQADLKQAWISLRKALYFRLYVETH
ncbi:MAG TPA: hypothetical protein VFE53_21980 [Mucilaginibacter sp.]|nr:hypothetical protein [Mucilaginibacter sp.]